LNDHTTCNAHLLGTAFLQEVEDLFTINTQNFMIDPMIEDEKVADAEEEVTDSEENASEAHNEAAEAHAQEAAEHAEKAEENDDK